MSAIPGLSRQITNPYNKTLSPKGREKDGRHEPTKLSFVPYKNMFLIPYGLKDKKEEILYQKIHTLAS